MNVAHALARQGVAVGYMTPVSSDRLGETIINRLVGDGVVVLAPRRSEPTSLAIVSVREGIPDYGFYRDGTAERQVSLAGLEAVAPPEAVAFHVGSLALAGGSDTQAYETFFDRWHKAGRFGSLDPNVRPRLIADRPAFTARIARMMQKADLVKLSDEDLRWLYPEIGVEDALARVRARSAAGLVVLTCGSKGAIGMTRTCRVAVEAARAEPLADTVGAGDTFHATLLAGLWQAGALSRAAIAGLCEAEVAGLLHRAAQAAAINCTRLGCDPPTHAELERLVPHG